MKNKEYKKWYADNTDHNWADYDNNCGIDLRSKFLHTEDDHIE